MDQNIIVLISEVSLFQEENNYVKLGLSQVFSLTKVSLLQRYPLERFYWNTKQCNLYFCSYNCWCTKNPGDGPQERLHLLSHPERFSHRSSNKTSLKYCLFGEEPPGLCCSTALAGAEIISWEIIGLGLTGWFLVTYEELLKMLGRALKAGIPVEKSLTRFIWASYYNSQ